ncbi:MAG: alanine-tRNA synthetase second additional domain-containing protein [Clostridiaceae bacterium]
MPFSEKMQKSHMFSTFYAPRGRKRIYELGMQIAQLYLSPFDQIIGIVGEAGSGKSALIKGMFPGLELTNDDDGVNVRPLPLLEQDDERGFFTPHTYHLDIRFEMGFTSAPVLADAILKAVRRGKRVIVEHFDLISPFLNMNANLLIGIGEEILVTRPNLFGPEPAEIFDIVHKSLLYRLMAHTAEDLSEHFLSYEDMKRAEHDDITHGFILSFKDKAPNVNLEELERKVKDLISQEIPICYQDEGHITIGGKPHACTGPRTHVSNTGDIIGFRLLKYLIYDSKNKRYLVVGCIGEDSAENLENVMKLNVTKLNRIEQPYGF